MEVWQSFRQAQRRCGCSTAVLKELAKVVETLLTNNGSDSSEEEEEVVTNASADVEMFRAGNAVVLQLHGCVGCHGYVFLPRDVRLRCPKCRHPRFNSQRKPNEVFLSLFHYIFFLITAFVVNSCYLHIQTCWYFPVRTQLRQLLRIPEYRRLLLHESRRVSNPNVMSDVYDSPRWLQLAGEPTQTLTRIMFQYCVDAFPWSNRKHQGSLKPAQMVVLSLPPWLRYQAKYMLVQASIIIRAVLCAWFFIAFIHIFDCLCCRC